jgi:hypothetical protein
MVGMNRLIIPTVLLCVTTVEARAGQAPEFDRPGIGFSTSTVGGGVVVWEQGLPDASRDRHDGITTMQWTADTLLRVGLGEQVEVQLGADSWSHLRVRGAGNDVSRSGGGDGSIALKWAPPLDSDNASVAFKAGATLPWGRTPLGDGGRDYDLGVTLAWELPRAHSLAVYADRQWGQSGSGWLFSPSYGFPISDAVSAYVEAGYGTGAQYMRAAGAGVTWMATPQLQLDASFLRGLDAASADWQGGVGLALYFD